jgi:hypothetical protein
MARRLVMRRRVTRAFALVVMACATAFTAITPAAAHDLDTDRFQVKVRGGNGHYEDVGRDGPSIGDYTVFRERVYHRGNRVGRNNGHCDVTRAGTGRFAFQCNFTMFLRGRGQITMQGLFAYGRRGPGLSGDESTVAITGGTGIYDHAAGTATIVAPPDEPVRYRFDMR